METLKINDVTAYVESNISKFHTKRLDRLQSLKLQNILKRKNPYLFKAKNVATSDQIVRSIVDAFLSSQEETIFGDWLEELAIYINGIVFKGWKSGIPGIDLEFEKENVRFIVSIKSGPNWGNSSQIKKMIIDFNKAKQTLRTSDSQMNIIPINGCCYGKTIKPDKNGVYFKYCGQKFWEFISNNSNLFIEIIEPLGYKAKEKNDTFLFAYNKLLNRFIKEFSNEFCLCDGSIDWQRIVKMNSSEFE